MNYTPIRLKLPVDMERIIKINDPVYSFSEVTTHIDLKKYFVEKEHETGRPRYDREKLLKVVLFAFMEFGYCSVRFIQKMCETDIRFLWLLDEEEAPSHMTINNFIHTIPGTILSVIVIVVPIVQPMPAWTSGIMRILQSAKAG